MYHFGFPHKLPLDSVDYKTPDDNEPTKTTGDTRIMENILGLIPQDTSMVFTPVK